MHSKGIVSGRSIRTFFIFLVIVSAIPALLYLLYITRYGVNGCFWDEYKNIAIIEKMYSGNLGLKDLIAAHNEHRIFLPRLIMLASVLLTHYDSRFEMFVSWLIICIISFLLWILFTNIFGKKKGTIYYSIVPWLLFCLRQRENITWGFQTAFFLTVLLFLLSICFLGRSIGFDLYFIISVSCAILLSLNTFNGLLIWPIGLLQIIWKKREGDRKSIWRKSIAIWAIIGILTCVFYFVDLKKPHSFSFSYFTKPLNIIAFFLALLGSPFTFDFTTSLIIGIIFLLLYVFSFLIIAKMRNKIIFPPIAMVLFSLLSSAETTIGRVSMGTNYALCTRYVTFTIVGCIGIYIIILMAYIRNGIKSFIIGVLIAIFVIGIASTDAIEMREGGSYKADRERRVYYLKNYKYQSEEMLKEGFGEFNREQIVHCAMVLEHYGLNAFHENSIDIDALEETDQVKNCNIDYINEIAVSGKSRIVISKKTVKTIIVIGWATDDTKNRPASAVFLDIDGEMTVPAWYGIKREDVVNIYRDKGMLHSGFYISIATENLSQGIHVFSFKIVGNDKKNYYVSDKMIEVEIREDS